MKNPYAGLTDYQIAIKWCSDMSKMSKLIVSDQFFAPFNKKIQDKLITELTESGYQIERVGEFGALITPPTKQHSAEFLEIVSKPLF